MLSRSYRREFLILVCVFLFGAGTAPAEHQSTRQLVVMPAAAMVSGEDGKSRPAKKQGCLPKGVRSDEVVSYGLKGSVGVTVEEKLVEMKARCRRGRLVDAKNREIRFFRRSCWGNPPIDYLEIKQRENDELDKLKRRYTVIVFGCNPMIH